VAEDYPVVRLVGQSKEDARRLLDSVKACGGLPSGPILTGLSRTYPNIQNNLVLSTFLEKFASWMTFFLLINSKPDFGGLFSLLTEAAQMIQNK
jgi:hypothetical protein